MLIHTRMKISAVTAVRDFELLLMFILCSRLLSFCYFSCSHYIQYTSHTVCMISLRSTSVDIVVVVVGVAVVAVDVAALLF